MLAKYRFPEEFSFGIGSRLFVLFFLYYASRGSDILAVAIIAALSLLTIGLIIKKFRVSYSLSSIILILVLVLNLFVSLLAPDATRAYISSQCFWLILVIYGMTLEKFFFRTKSNISQNIVLVVGIFLLIIYIAGIFNPQYFWLFEALFLPEGGEVSRYSNGAVRLYSVAAVCFLIIPVTGYSKLFSFVINALPLSPVNILAWFVVHGKILLFFLLFFTSISLFLYTEDDIFSQLSAFIYDKGLSIESRLDKMSAIKLIGAEITFDDNFSETFWVALAQSNGLLLSFVFFVLFFYKLYMLSKNIYFIFAAIVLTFVNPFPLALIYLLAGSWNMNALKNE